MTLSEEARALLERMSAEDAIDKVIELTLQAAARLVESKDDGIWANTCGHSIRALKDKQ